MNDPAPESELILYQSEDGKTRLAEGAGHLRHQHRLQCWIAKLDDFLRLSERDILTHAGKVTQEAVLAKAEAEHEKFRVLEAGKPSPVELHFEAAIQEVKQLAVAKEKPKKKGSRGK